MIDQKIFEKYRNFHGVKGLIFCGEKILVYRRDTKTNSFPLYIDLPGGAKEENESSFDSFKREVKEEFGIDIEQKDIVYAKQYMSEMDSNKESHFIVVKPDNISESDIIFGDEGLEYILLKPEEYINLNYAIKRQQYKVSEYLDWVNNS